MHGSSVEGEGGLEASCVVNFDGRRFPICVSGYFRGNNIDGRKCDSSTKEAFDSLVTIETEVLAYGSFTAIYGTPTLSSPSTLLCAVRVTCGVDGFTN